MTMDGFVHPLLYGMCDSLQPAVGFNWGARNIQRVKAIEKRCYTAAIILALATTGVLALFPRRLPACSSPAIPTPPIWRWRYMPWCCSA